MVTKRKTFDTIDEYISEFTPDVQKRLKQVREVIRQVAPKTEEGISYGIPTFYYEGKYLIYFAGFIKHIGLYPAPKQHPLFKDELSKYKGGKGTIQIPHDDPLPIGLIKRIVKFKMKETLEKKSAGKKTPTKAAKQKREA